MVEEYYEDELNPEERIEEEQEKLEEAEERQEALAEQTDASLTYPAEIEKPGAFSFFNKVIEKRDSSKIGNLTKEELGGTRLSVRDYQSMANFEEFMGHDKVALYFRSKAEITSGTSLSKDGFLMKLAITQRKEKARLKGGTIKKGWLKKEE